jgi:hypothetical protein
MRTSEILEAAMDPELVQLEADKAVLKKEYAQLEKERLRLSLIAGILDDVYRDVNFRNQIPPQSWDYHMRSSKKRVNALLRDKSYPRYTKKSINANDRPVPSKEEAATARKIADDYNTNHVRPVGKAIDNAQQAIRDYKKIKTQKSKALANPRGNAICQLCFRPHQLDKNSVLTRHGWKEAGGRMKGVYGNTWHGSSCPGSGYKPFQVSKVESENQLARLQSTLKILKAAKGKTTNEMELRHGPFAEIAFMVSGQIAGMLPTTKHKDTAARNEKLPRAFDMLIGGFTSDINTFKKMLNGWKKNQEWIKAVGYTG